MKVAIIGSGLAGLASAIRLQCHGHTVHVFEANSYPGGKINQIQENGFRFDAGPSVCTMPWLMDELFELANKNPRDYFNYYRKDVVSKYFFPDGKVINGYFDREKLKKEIDNVLGSGGFETIKYLEEAERVHQLAGDIFLNKPINRLSTFSNVKTAKAILNLPTLGIFTTLNRESKSSLPHKELIQIFNRYATYNGSDPYRAPGILKTISHLEYGMGTYYINGGFYSMTSALYTLATELGVKFSFDSKVTRIDVYSNHVSGITVRKECLKFDSVVSNMDIIPTYKHLLEEKYPFKSLQKQERSTSMIVFYWGIKGKFPQLDLHNAFFSEDYKKDFDELFFNKSISNDPTIYLNITSKEEPEDAPENCENWFVMVNAPSIDNQNWDELIGKTRKNMVRKLSQILNVNIEDLIVYEKILTPIDIEKNTSSYKGSIYGASSNSKFAAFLRQPNNSSDVKGLYFAGGSVHPGGGTPLCLLSAKIATDLILEKA